MPKHLGEMTFDELEKLALKEISLEEKEEADPILLFLSTFDINPGPHWVSATTMLNLYNAWRGSRSIKKPSGFAQKLGNFFKNDRGRGGYLISRTAQDLYGRMTKAQLKRKRRPTWDLQSFEFFCKARKIKKGSFWVEAEALYHLYDLWSFKNKKQMSLTRFIRVASLILESRVVSSGGTWFRVSEDVRQFLTDEIMSELRVGWKRRDERKEEGKKKSAIGREVSLAAKRAESED